MKAPVFKIGDLVRLAERTAVKHNNFPRNIGIVIGFAKTMQSGWTENGTCAKIEWTSGSLTEERLATLEKCDGA